MKLLARLAALCSVALLIGGCGGGGGGNNTPGSSRVAVFLTDDLRPGYSHVWVTIYKVELVSDTGATATVFSDSAGRVVDLRTLRDNTGQRFEFLTEALVNGGTYTKARVTMGPNAVLFPTGSNTGQTLTFADTLPHDTQGNVIVEFNLAAPRHLSGNDYDLVIDFDLGSWTIANGKITPVVREDESHNGLANRERHSRGYYTGTISGLTGNANGYQFTLTLANGQTVTVMTDANTSIFNQSNATNPTLANGKRVQVRGVFDTAANRLMASDIRIKDTGEISEAEVTGVPSNLDATAGTFEISTVRVKGFVPTATPVHVVTNGTTIFRLESGLQVTQAEFFALLANAPLVEVEGSYDAGTNTLTATRMKIEDDNHQGGHEAEARGVVTLANAVAGTFTLNPIASYEGFMPNGTTVAIATNGSTVFKNSAGTNITAAEFFGLLTGTVSVKVEGVYQNGVLTAQEVRIVT